MGHDVGVIGWQLKKKLGKIKRTFRVKDFRAKQAEISGQAFGPSRCKFRAKHSGQAAVNFGRHFGPSACRFQASFQASFWAGQGANSSVHKVLQFGLLLQLRVHQWVCRCPNRLTVFVYLVALEFIGLVHGWIQPARKHNHIGLVRVVALCTSLRFSQIILLLVSVYAAIAKKIEQLRNKILHPSGYSTTPD